MMERGLAPALVLGAFVGSGCGKDKDDSEAPACEIQLVSTVPETGSSDAYYRAAIEATFDDEDDTAMITLFDDAGHAVPGTESRSDDAKTAYFTPTDPLTPGASYTAEIMWCGMEETETFDFTASSLGEPVTDPAAIEGRTYLVNLREARFAEPAGVGPLIALKVRQSILLTVTSVDATSLTMMGALTSANGSTQDFCLPTIDFPKPADFSESPYWVVEADQATLSVADNDVAIEDLVISGTFAADGATFGGGVLAGTIDTSLLGGILGQKDPAYLCELAEDFGDDCVACPDGSPYCLGLRLDQLVGTSAGMVAIRPIDQRECDAECPLSVKNPKCEKYYVPPK
jgi:hypothetical protein